MKLILIFNFNRATLQTVPRAVSAFARSRGRSVIVCHCKGLSDRDIGKAVREGAASAADVVTFCAAGSDCGGCRPVIEEILANHDPARQGADTQSAD